MKFIEALSVLSKSSPFAVSTKRNTGTDYAELKSYLYIQRQIEKDFVNLLKSKIGKKCVIFLCGSSGDGKSEILLRCQESLPGQFDYHLDGTHSFHPSETAIDTLNQRFSNYKLKNNPLVIGINTGMLGNFCEDGAQEHQDIRNIIRCYLAKSFKDFKECTFVAFEDYPVFEFISGSPKCSFAKKLMQKISVPDSSNPFYRLYENEMKGKRQEPVFTNYQLLSIESIQDSIIELLLMAHLAGDQFITSRTLIDFFYEILCGDGYLFENLFQSDSNDILKTMRRFDPAVIRNRKLDEFLVERRMGTSSEEFESFKTYLTGLGIEEELMTSEGYLRLFFLLRETSIGNNFHKRFQAELTNTDLKEYIDAWCLHALHTSECDKSAELRTLYKNRIGNGLQKFMNRKVPENNNKSFLISDFGIATISCDLKLKPDLKRIEEIKESSGRFFNVSFSVNNQPFGDTPIEMSFNMFSLLKKVGDGFQPTIFSCSSLVNLEEVARQILLIAKKQNVLMYKARNSRCTFTNEVSYIEVDGLDYDE